MAKKFSDVVVTAKETAYGTPATAFVLAASMNSSVQFTVIQKPNGTEGDLAVSAQYSVNRAKRIKSKKVANPNTLTTAAALAALDQFSTIDWDAVDVATGTLSSIGVKRGINAAEKFDPDDVGTTDAKAIADHVSVSAIERNEELMVELLTNIKAANVTALTAAAAGTVPIFDFVETHATKIMLFSDEFKHTTSAENILVLMNPLLKNRAIKEIGQEFNNELPIYKTGLKSTFGIAGFPVLFDASLNKFEKTDVKDRFGIVVVDIESMAFKAEKQGKMVNVDLGLATFTGEFYYNIQKLVDTERAFAATFDATGLAAKTPKVSD